MIPMFHTYCQGWTFSFLAFLYIHFRKCLFILYSQDLTPSHLYPDQKLTGKFIGQCYTTHDIRYIINHIGGIELLFPLLENVLLSQSVANSGDVLTPTVRLDEVTTATGECLLLLLFTLVFVVYRILMWN